MSYPGNKIDDLLQNRTPGGPAAHRLGPSPSAGPSGTDPDPIRIYLQQMSVVPLLTREGEVEIAKRIEKGQEILLKAVSRSQPAMAQLLSFKDRLESGKTGIKKLVNLNEESLTPSTLEARCRKLCSNLDEIKKLNDKILKLEPRLAGGKKRTTEDKKLRWQLAQNRLSVRRKVTHLDLRAEIQERLVDTIKKTGSDQQPGDLAQTSLGNNDDHATDFL